MEGRAEGGGGGKGVVGSGSDSQRGNRPGRAVSVTGRAVSVTGRVVFVAVGTTGWRSNTAVENGS